MPSFKSQLFYLLVRKQGVVQNKRGFFIPELTSKSEVELKNFFKIPNDINVDKTLIGDVPCEILSPTCQVSEGVLLYVHGATSNDEDLASRRFIAAQLAVKSGVQVVFCHYKASVKFRYPCSLNELYAVYCELEKSTKGSQITLAGDSFGAGMALVLAMKLRDGRHKQPLSIALISPWTDLSLSNESHRKNVGFDAYFEKQKSVLEKSARAYADREKLIHPMISPQFADLNGLPPTLIHVGDHEVLYDDARVLAIKMSLQSCQVELRVFSGMWHLWQSFCGNFDEATQSINEISKFIQEKHSKLVKKEYKNG